MKSYVFNNWILSTFPSLDTSTFSGGDLSTWLFHNSNSWIKFQLNEVSRKWEKKRKIYHLYNNSCSREGGVVKWVGEANMSHHSSQCNFKREKKITELYWLQRGFLSARIIENVTLNNSIMKYWLVYSHNAQTLSIVAGTIFQCSILSFYAENIFLNLSIKLFLLHKPPQT